MRQSVLTDQQAQFLREEKEALAGMQLTLAGLDLPREVPGQLAKSHPATGRTLPDRHRG